MMDIETLACPIFRRTSICLQFFAASRRKMLANYLELHVFFVFSLCSPKWANKNTSKRNMEVIPSQSKYHLRPKTSTHKVPFFRRNLWCFGRYQEIGETYACFQVARFPGFGVLTYRTFHGTMDELRVSMTNGLKVWFDGVASPFWIIMHSFVAQQVLALILVYRYLDTIFIINHSIGPSVLIQLYIYTPYIISVYGNWMKFRWFLNSSQNAMFFLWKANGQRKQAHFLKESFLQKHSHKSADWQV